MKIKLHQQNSQKIAAALRKVNGSADTHTFTYMGEIVEELDDLLNSLQKLPKKYRPGMLVTLDSGGCVATSYKYTRTITSVTLLRGSKDWFLVGIDRLEVFPDYKPKKSVLLTVEQKDKLFQYTFPQVFVTNKAGQEK